MEHVRVSITLPESVYMYLRGFVDAAREDGVRVSVNRIINDAVDYYLDHVDLRRSISGRGWTDLKVFFYFFLSQFTGSYVTGSWLVPPQGISLASSSSFSGSMPSFSEYSKSDRVDLSIPE